MGGVFQTQVLMENAVNISNGLNFEHDDSNDTPPQGVSSVLLTL